MLNNFIGIRKGLFISKLGIGITDTILEKGSNKYHILNLDANISMGIQNKLKISENIKNSEENLERIVKELPLFIAYKFSITLKNKYIDLSSVFRIGADFTKYGVVKNEEKILNQMDGIIYLQGKLDSGIHINNNVGANLGISVDNKKNNINFEAKLGMTIEW